VSEAGGPLPTPQPLRLVEEFVNTRSVEFGTDDVATPDALGEWLRARGLVAEDAPVDAAHHARALRVREGVRALIAAGHSELSVSDPATPDGIDPAALADLIILARALPVVLDAAHLPPRLSSPDPGTVDAALALLLAAVAEAVADGTWSRFKVCREPGCRWAYYDHSRNRSRAWCSMDTCGNRAKARAFRSRAR
jgi:predicted RNA-binding Zn ribbon-like protein